MDFASKYVFNYSDSDEESVSDDEFQRGMSVSDDSDSDDDLDVPAIRKAPPPCPVMPVSKDSGMDVDSVDTAESSMDIRETVRKPGAAGPSTSPDIAPAPPGAPKSRGSVLLGKIFGALGSGSGGGGGTERVSLSASRRKYKSAPAKKVSHWKTPVEVSSNAARLPPVPGERHTSSPSGQRRRYRKADTNVVSIKFKTLIAPSHMHTGDPVYCQKCSGILSRISKLEEAGADKLWQCEFCGESNELDIMDEEIPQIDDVTFMLEPAPATTTSGLSGTDESLVIFCVDVSGSMCVTTEVPGRINLRGSTLRRMQSLNTTREDQHMPRERRDVTYISRLQAVQAAVDHQLEELAKDYPHRRVALISFNNEVDIVGDGTQNPVCVSGDKLKNKEVLAKVGTDMELPKSLRESRVALGDKVFGLEEGGSTALGPALTVAISMAARCPGSKVIVCTDGQANIGLGSMENQEGDKARELTDDFYTGLGETALQNSTSVSVVSIKGTDCKLAQLGRVADLTGGQVNIVDPLKLTQEFSTILADRVIATNVEATFLIHSNLYIRNEDVVNSKSTRIIGNVTAESEITFEYGIRREKTKKSDEEKPKKPEDKTDNTSGPGEPEGATAGESSTGAFGGEASSKSAPGSEAPKEYPFQLQIKYKDTEGALALRVFTQSKPITTERNLAEKEVNLDVLGIHAAQTSAQLALAGDYSKSRGVALMQQRLAWRYGHAKQEKESKAKYRGYFSKIKSVENRVNMMQQKERSERGTTYSDEDDDMEEFPRDIQVVMSALDTPDTNPSNKKKKKKKLQLSRTSECPDDAASDLYNMRSANVFKINKK